MTGQCSRYKNVSFRFLRPDESTDLPGTVTVRPGEMVLSIPGGFGPYTIVGLESGQGYGGTNKHPQSRYAVAAQWCAVDGTYMGLWHENNCQCHFSFRLGHPSLPGDVD